MGSLLVLSIMKREGLTVYPTKSLICNIGNDNTGVHCGYSSRYNIHLQNIKHKKFILPADIQVNEDIVNNLNKFLNAVTEQNNPFFHYYNTLNLWMKLINKGIGIKTYFEKNNINTIAIYGAGEIGQRLYEQLKSSDVNVRYIIDKNEKFSFRNSFDGVEVVNITTLKDIDIDAIVVTPIYAFNEIYKELSNKDFSCKIINFKSLIYELFI